MYASFRLGFSGWRLEKVTGIINQSRSSGCAGIISRDIDMEGIDRHFQLMYPFGKRHHPGQQCELLLLPGTQIAVDLRLVLPLNSSGDLGERILVPENLNQGERK